jgi:hypothetical protein
MAYYISYKYRNPEQLFRIFFGYQHTFIFLKKKKGYGSKIVAIIDKGMASLKINTISGDIYLRKK